MKDSGIEWTDHTFNPWIGCTKVSPGCLHCYAETRDKRHLIEKVDHWGKGAPRLRTSASYWKQPLKWNREAVADLADAERENCAHLHRRPRVFCASLADIFDDEVPIEWLADFLALVHKCQNLDFQLLTKRPENFFSRLRDAFLHCMYHRAPRDNMHLPMLELWTEQKIAPPNVWLGTSVEDQARADERIPLLLRIPAAVLFLSCEPLLGPVDLGRFCLARLSLHHGELVKFLHWVIAGGESGPNARPMHPDWARSLRDQCVAAGVPFFFKQWGEWGPACALYPKTEAEHEQNERAGCYGEIALEPDGVIAEGYQPGSGTWLMNRPGKHAAGRELDGREWSEFPNSSLVTGHLSLSSSQ